MSSTATAGRMYPTDAEVLQLLREHKTDGGRRFYLGNLGENVTLLVGACRRFSAGAGHKREVFTCWRDLAAEIWPGVDHDTIDLRARSLRRWARELEAIGVMEFKPWVRATGKTRGIVFRWTFTPQLDSAAASARSSAGSSYGCPGVRRRRETASQRYEGRIRPYDRRGGQKVAKRFVRTRAKAENDSSAFFSEPRFVRPIGHSSPSGSVSVKEQDFSGAAPPVNTVGSQFEASPAVPGRDVGNGTTAPLTSTAATRTRSAAPDRAAELSVALAAFERRFGRPSLPVKPATFRLWEKATRRGDRYAGWGRPKPGASVQFVADRIEAWGAEPRRPRPPWPNATAERPAAPASIAYFVKLLDDASKHWRHAYRHEHGMCGGDDVRPCRYWGPGNAPFARRNSREKWKRYDREQAAAHGHLDRHGRDADQVRDLIRESLDQAGGS